MDAQAQAYPAAQPVLPEVLATAGELTVRLARTPEEIAAAQALRYEVFYKEMAAAPTPEMAALERDFDRFDEICDILLVIDGARPSDQAVVGTYRMLRQEVAWANDGFYSADEYDLTPLSRRFSESERGLELGRSCVHRDYRSNATIQLLWRAIAEYMATYNIAWMFGCASLPGTEPDALAEPLSFLHHHCLAPEDLRVRAVPDRYVGMDRLPAEDVSPRRALAMLPPLIKGYLRLGAHIGDGAVIDPQFGTTDVCIILPVRRIGQRYFSHFRPSAENGGKA